AAYPLLTCLLCISQNKFFLSTWVQFLNLTLANLKNKDSRISRMALESLYRLICVGVRVYTVRISCESNSVTRSRLEGICASLFPRGSRNVVPRDAPLNIFVKIIHFISQYRIDFAFREIIYDLLGCSRTSSRTLSIYPERMNIGIRALMVIFDGLQQNESPPGMPRSIGFVPFGTIQRQKRSYLTQPLSIETAISLGLEQYYPACRKAFDSILRTLDAQIGRSFMLTASHVRGKEYNEVINSEMRAKLDLFRTCIAAIPRFLPDPMSHQDLIEFVIRMCVHVDEEIRLTAYQSLQNLVAECPDWREDLFHIFLRFLINQIQDTFPTLLESMVRLLLQLLSVWKLNFIEHQKNESIMLKLSTNKVGISSQSSISESCELTNSHTSFERYISATAFALHCIEGLALTLLCQLRPQIKRMAISLLYEVKGFLDCFPQKHHYETPVIEVLDEATPYVMEKYIQHVSENEKKTWHKDFASFCEIVSNVGTDPLLVNEDHGNEYLRWDVWASALSGFSEHRFLPSKCTVAISFAWPALLTRFNYCHQIIDPNNPQNENRSSLLRSSKSRYTNWPLCGDILSHENYLSLWQKYIVMVFGLFQSKTTFLSNPSLIRKAVILLKIRWEATDIKDAVVLGMGSMNSECFELLFEEFNLKGILREVGERKNETNLRRKKRKDALRLQLLRILELALTRRLFDHSFFDRHSGSLSPLLLEFIESVRFHVESETIRDVKTMRIHFAKVVTEIVCSVPLDLRENLLPMDLRRSLFFLFFSWCSRILANSNDNRRKENDIGIHVEQKAIQAMCALFCVGSVFECQGQFGDEDYILRWVEALLSSNNSTINGICEELLCTMLHLNENYPQLFEKVLQMCYIKDELVGSRCFRSLALLFSQREYPCEFISLLCLCGTFASDAEDSSIRQTTYLFISLLKRQFLDINLSPLNLSSILDEHNKNVRLQNNVELKPNYFSISQTCISQQLAKQYSQLTMPIFSEICSRIETARPNRQVSMLIFLHEWIKNIVLVDNYCDIYLPLKDEGKEENGWGSEEATQLLLNNLLFLTAKLSCEHDKEIRELWKCLATNFKTTNLPIIVHFLFMMISLSLENMLPLAKKISSYILEACGEEFVSLLVNNLENVGKPFKHFLCRSEMPPFYRWENETKNEENFENKIEEINNNEEIIEEEFCEEKNINNNQDITTTPTLNSLLKIIPKQLPMPPYGGNYSRLSLLFQPQQNNNGCLLSRSHMSLFLLCDLIGLKTSIGWNDYIPKLLHIAVINLDSNDKIICFHSRQIIINICLMFIADDLRNQENIKESNLDEVGLNLNNSTTTTNNGQQLFAVDALFCSKTELLKCLLFCLSQNKNTSLWTFEDTTQRCWITESSKYVGRFVQRLVDFLQTKLPELANNWTQFAIHFAFNVSNRHYFGRSFQIAGSLGTSPVPFIPLLISRLVDIFSENNDETQSFIIELFICLQRMVQSVDNNSKTFSNGHCRSISYTRNFWEPLEANKKEEKKAFSQIATISLLMLESNIDNEFLIGLHTFDKILQASGNQRFEFLVRLEEIVNKSWELPNNTEIVALALKGILYPFHGYECSISIFSKCLLNLNQKIVCSNSKESFALIVTASLPYCIQNFNSPTSLCSKLAQSIATHCRTELDQLSKEKGVNLDTFSDHPLSNLITMMDQYREQKFPRDHPQWTKCVINYLLDAFKPDTFQLIIVLTEMLERSPIALHSSLLDMLLLLFNYGNLNNCPPAYFNSQIVKTIFKHIHGSSSREASRIFKVILEQWNAISVDKISQNEKDFLAKRKPEFEIRFEKPFLHEISVDKLSSLDSFGSARQKIRKKLLTLFSTFGLPIGATRHLSVYEQSLSTLIFLQLKYRVCSEINDINTQNDQDELGDDEEEFYEDNDLDSNNSNNNTRCDDPYSPKSFRSGGTNSSCCNRHSSLESVEHLWNNLISRLDNDQNGIIISNSIILLTQLFREKSIFLVRILRDSLDIFNSSQQQQKMSSDISQLFLRSLNFLLKFVECPFLFVSSQFINSSNLLDSIKIALFELREHFDAFNEHYEQSLREFLLYKSLHKLCFQLLLVVEKFIEMCLSVQNFNNSQESDLTPAVASLQKELLSHLSTSSSLDSFKTSNLSLEGGGGGGNTCCSNSSSIISKQQNFDLNQSRDVLMLHTTNKQFRNAFGKLTQLRSQYCNTFNGQFGCCEQIDVDVLLLNFCRSHCSLRVWAMIGSFEQLRSWCSQLKESNVQIGILLRNISDK
uniref:Non-specific serine/threonine protein kinase n=4 Tax=Meloidogyne TaxID=189290 RepID=A0A915M906_MELJA